MEELLELLKEKEEKVHNLERLLDEKEARIQELTSHLDKYRSVLQLGTPPGSPAPSAGAGGTRKLQRAWGISAEPQPCTLALQDAGARQKFSKDER